MFGLRHRSGVDAENDTKTIVWTENISFVFKMKPQFSNLSELVLMGPETLEHHPCNALRFRARVKRRLF